MCVSYEYSFTHVRTAAASPKRAYCMYTMYARKNSEYKLSVRRGLGDVEESACVCVSRFFYCKIDSIARTDATSGAVYRQ